MQKDALDNLHRWFISEQRDLPWRNNSSPYAVWVSEIMLQQTQVAVVIPYFERWMTLFPTVKALAAAPIEIVIKTWEGLGYYSRARNLHEGAKYIVENHEGILPQTTHELLKIKGIGIYTVGAILSFAFHQRVAAVDGNVLRVLSRYYCLADDISKAKNVKKIQELAQNLLPEQQSWIISEALIELGATICGRKPQCSRCPLQRSCLGYQQGMVTQLPFKSAKMVTTNLHRIVTVIYSQDLFLVKCGDKGKVMADLYEFPYFEIEQEAVIKKSALQKKIKNDFKLNVKWEKNLKKEKHSFTRYQVLLSPHLFSLQSPVQVEHHQWLSLKDLQQLPFSSGHRRILASIKEEELFLDIR